MVILTTNGPLGPEATPRGDPAGFRRVQGDRILLLPDRRGNSRVDALRNIMSDLRVGLLFLILGICDTLHVHDMARSLHDKALEGSFEIAGPCLATVLEIEVRKLFHLLISTQN